MVCDAWHHGSSLVREATHRTAIDMPRGARTGWRHWASSYLLAICMVWVSLRVADNLGPRAAAKDRINPLPKVFEGPVP